MELREYTFSITITSYFLIQPILNTKIITGINRQLSNDEIKQILFLEYQNQNIIEANKELKYSADELFNMYYQIATFYSKNEINNLVDYLKLGNGNIPSVAKMSHNNRLELKMLVEKQPVRDINYVYGNIDLTYEQLEDFLWFTLQYISKFNVSMSNYYRAMINKILLKYKANKVNKK